MVHIRFEGKSYDVQEQELRVHTQLNAEEIKQRLAAYFDVDSSRFDFYVVDHRPNGHMVIRPEAVYG